MRDERVVYIERERGRYQIGASIPVLSWEGTRRATPSLGTRCQVTWETQSRNIRVRRRSLVLASDCWVKGCTCIKKGCIPLLSFGTCSSNKIVETIWSGMCRLDTYVNIMFFLRFLNKTLHFFIIMKYIFCTDHDDD